MKIRKIYKAIMYVFIAISLTLAILFCNSLISTLKFISASISTQGKVIDIHQRDISAEFGRHEFPIIEFENKNNKKIVFITKESYNGCKINESVDILYDKNNNKNARIKGISIWDSTIGLGVMFIISFLISFVIVYWYKKYGHSLSDSGFITSK